jgi:hypothetical protein
VHPLPARRVHVVASSASLEGDQVIGVLAVALAFVAGWLARRDWDRVGDDPYAELRRLAPTHPSLSIPPVRLVASRPHLWDHEVDG